MELPRTPMDNLMNVLSGLSVGHEKALRQAIYNAVALLLLCLACIASYGLYIILHPFVKPLIWALLCGSVLFPFKLYITNSVQAWFAETDNSLEPLLVNLAMVPMRIMDRLSEAVGSFLHGHIKYVGIILASTTAITLIYWYTPNILACLTWRLLQFGGALISLFVTNCNIHVIYMMVIGYLSIVYVFWNSENAIYFNYASLVVWLIFSLFVSNTLGMYQVIIFCILQILCIAGFIYQVVCIMEQKEVQGNTMNFTDAVYLALTGNDTVEVDTTVLNETEEEKNNLLEENDDDINKPHADTDRAARFKYLRKAVSLDAGPDCRSEYLTDTKNMQRSSSYTNSQFNSIRERYFLRKLRTEFCMSLDLPDDQVDTDKYMYGAIYACIGMLMWKHKWILSILALPVFWYITKKMSKYFGFSDIICSRLNIFTEHFNNWYRERQQALIPSHISGLYKIYIIIDKKIREILKKSIDTVATIAVIFGLLIFAFCTTIFIMIQIYAEAMHLLNMTGEILNSTLVNNPDIDWLPEQWEDSVNNVLDNAYTYGRSAISDGVKNLIKDLEPSKGELFEKKVLELWDRLYQAWMMSDESPDLIGPTVNVAAAVSVWESIKESFGKVPSQMFNVTGIQNLAKENIGILVSVLESVWSIVKGNMSIMSSILTELLYIVLMSGSAVLNFTLSTVVFFTTLFYLLNSSGKIYKPIELMALFSPTGLYSKDKSSGFAVALQEAVIGVFAATFKLASFFGMWTWFIHNLFQVKIVYLPSLFATILAAVPFLDAYFACLPATIELWFTRSPMISILFFTFHFLPCNIVITDFYKEIKGGGHPYLTGLSIAGGVFCLGVEGAIFGPLLLCCIMVAINLSRRYVHSLATETLVSFNSQINQLKTDEHDFQRAS